MEDKEKIEEMKDIIHNLWDKLNQDSITTDDIVDAFYNAGYRNCKDRVVLSREEINSADYFYVKDGELVPVEKGRGKFITTEWYKELLMKMPLDHELAKERKETTEKTLKEIMHIPVIEGKFVKVDDLIDKLKEIATREGVEVKGVNCGY